MTLTQADAAQSLTPALLLQVLGNNSLTGELSLWTGFPKAQLFGLSNNELSGVLPDRWTFADLTQLQVWAACYCCNLASNHSLVLLGTVVWGWGRHALQLLSLPGRWCGLLQHVCFCTASDHCFLSQAPSTG